MLLELPDEVLFRILVMLDGDTLCAMALMCKRLNRLCRDHVWPKKVCSPFLHPLLLLSSSSSSSSSSDSALCEPTLGRSAFPRGSNRG
mmetsp:Transcript_12684/g.38862  ORF Transcript_12684/g.38862 Transcript_12684/m.38862 type:complete len:88 (+) Transcript_12684:178-441(+)